MDEARYDFVCSHFAGLLRSLTWVESILNVALPNNAKVANDLDCSFSEHEVLAVRQGLGRSNDNGVASVDPEGVKVLHRAKRGEARLCAFLMEQGGGERAN